MPPMWTSSQCHLLEERAYVSAVSLCVACTPIAGPCTAPSKHPSPLHWREDTTQPIFLYPSLTCPWTAVQCVHMLEVVCGESPPVPELTGAHGGGQRQNGGPTVAAEGSGAVVHDRLVVIVYSLGCRKASADLVKLALQT